MAENFITCINTTLPAFVLILLGLALSRAGLMPEDFTAKLNRFVFLFPLPVMVFYDLASKNFREAWNGRFVFFCFAATLLSIGGITLISGPLCRKAPEERGEFIQAAYRSSAAILGVMLAENMYGDAGMIPMMILGAVPLYNAFAVVVLIMYGPKENEKDQAVSHDLLRHTLLNILKNPLIISIFLGLAWSLSGTRFPVIADRTLSSISATATPLGLLALGASIRAGRILSRLKLTLIAVFLKLAGLGMIFIPVAVWLGFRNDTLLAAVIMCGSPTTVTSFVMAKGFGNNGDLSGAAVLITTLLSSVTLTGWLFLLRTLGYL